MSIKTNMEVMYANLVSAKNALTSAPAGVVNLTQADFVNGTYQIKNPNYVYVLSENIDFNPNNLAMRKLVDPNATSYESGDVLSTQFTNNGGEYDPAAFGIGFFAAISVQCDNVCIDLNGKKIEQSAEHALQQRFYANIELASAPFIPSQGPHNFGNSVISAKNVYIYNGTLGRSSHHGIHGNDNENILIENVNFANYEVSPVALNNVNNFSAVNCNIISSRKDVPVLGIFSAARFIRPFMEYLNTNHPSFQIVIQKQTKNAKQLRNELRNSLNKTFDAIMLNGELTPSDKNEYELFANKKKVVDGNSYGFIINGKGVAVNGFPKNVADRSTNVYFKNISIGQHEGNINEVLALSVPDLIPNDSNPYGAGAQHDPIGAVLQLFNKNNSNNYLTVSDNANNGMFRYVGNVVSNCQLLITSAINANKFNGSYLPYQSNNIEPKLLDWVSGKKSFNQVSDGIFANGDSMFHVNKGVIGFKLDGVDTLYAENCDINILNNFGNVGSTLGQYDAYINGVGKSHPSATYFGYGGASLRGWSFSSSKNVVVNGGNCVDLNSSSGDCIGVDVHQDSDNITIQNMSIVELEAGKNRNLNEYQGNPTAKPRSIGFHSGVGSTNVVFQGCNCLNVDLKSPYQVYDYLIENGSTTVS